MTVWNDMMVWLSTRIKSRRLVIDPNTESLLMEYLLQAAHVIVRMHDALPMSSVADADKIYISRRMRGEEMDCRQRAILCDLLRHVVRMIHHHADHDLLHLADEIRLLDVYDMEVEK